MNRQQMELELLYAWNQVGVVEIYRFGNVIKWYEPDKKAGVVDRTLFTDFSNVMFPELSIKEHGVASNVLRVEDLLKERLK